MTFEKIFTQWLNRVLPNRSFSRLGVVTKIYTENAYCADLTLIETATMNETVEQLQQVPFMPLWAGKNGQGVYAPPEEKQVVVVGFINGSPSYPYIAGVYGEDFTAKGVKQKTLVIESGQKITVNIDDDAVSITANKTEFTLDANTGLFSMKSAGTDLKTLLEKILDEIADLQTQGSPANHTVNPASVAKLKLIKSDVAKLLQ